MSDHCLLAVPLYIARTFWSTSYNLINPFLVSKSLLSDFSNNKLTVRDGIGKTSAIQSLCLIGSDDCETQFFSPRFSDCSSRTPTIHSADTLNDITMTIHGFLATVNPTLYYIIEKLFKQKVYRPCMKAYARLKRIISKE